MLLGIQESRRRPRSPERARSAGHGAHRPGIEPGRPVAAAQGAAKPQIVGAQAAERGDVRRAQRRGQLGAPASHLGGGPSLLLVDAQHLGAAGPVSVQRIRKQLSS